MESNGDSFDIVRLTPDEVRTREVFVRAFKKLIPKPKWLQFLSGLRWIRIKDFELNHAYFLAAPSIRKILFNCAHKKLLILIIDEAHTLDNDVAYSLLNTTQSVQNANLPLLMVLAGTTEYRRSPQSN